MDGNGRWATIRDLPRMEGHRSGVLAASRAVESALDAGVRSLTPYAFSADNWRRSAPEVQGIFWLLRAFLHLESERLFRREVRIQMIGRRDRLAKQVLQSIEAAEQKTFGGRKLHLRVANVDVLIRTGGKQGLSDFLLWESAYAGLVFTERMWPDFDRADIEKAVTDFMKQERRYGGLGSAAAHPSCIHLAPTLEVAYCGEAG